MGPHSHNAAMVIRPRNFAAMHCGFGTVRTTGLMIIGLHCVLSLPIHFGLSVLSFPPQGSWTVSVKLPQASTLHLSSRLGPRVSGLLENAEETPTTSPKYHRTSTETHLYMYTSTRTLSALYRKKTKTYSAHSSTSNMLRHLCTDAGHGHHVLRS